MSIMSVQWQLGLIIGPTVGGLLARKCCGSFPYLLPCAICGLLQMSAIVPLMLCDMQQRPQLEQVVIDPAVPASDKLQLVTEATEVTNDQDQRENQMAWEEMVCDVKDLEQSERQDGRGAWIALADASGGKEKPDLDEPAVSERWLRGNRPLWIMLFVYCCFSVVSITTDEITSLWALASVGAGGLAAGPEYIGVILAVTGISSMLFQVILGPRLVERWGYRGSIRYGGVIAGAAVFFVPFTKRLLDLGSAWPMIALMILSTIKQAGFYFGFVSSFVLLNNSVPPSCLGRANGLGMMLSSICKAVGPALFSPLFAWSLTLDDMPMSQHLYFVLVAGFLVVIGLAIVPLIPLMLERSWEDRESDTATDVEQRGCRAEDHGIVHDQENESFCLNPVGNGGSLDGDAETQEDDA
eukprot:TRINITY_DN3691_c0_g1_i2.p1 TRINITY_DN3691_c0_g1~~TRINITY_DN3691_c0_g1_i2.p1  ORF type:complete len:411 (+),score=57.02 TRINITY_DN3691_c0_g1_i2:229-1461(+)